jgi:hypothetical protein
VHVAVVPLIEHDGVVAVELDVGVALLHDEGAVHAEVDVVAAVDVAVVPEGARLEVAEGVHVLLAVHDGELGEVVHAVALPVDLAGVAVQVDGVRERVEVDEAQDDGVALLDADLRPRDLLRVVRVLLEGDGEDVDHRRIVVRSVDRDGVARRVVHVEDELVRLPFVVVPPAIAAEEAARQGDGPQGDQDEQGVPCHGGPGTLGQDNACRCGRAGVTRGGGGSS